ncbi:MAG TPA: hypothetical protein HPQ03_11305 [Deltaproteobacteria bacterium]|nr:hypothetical protein [Deltaproteobacteria bacterium]
MLYKKPLVNLTPLLDLLFIVIFAYQMNVNLGIDDHIQTEVEKRIDQHEVEKQQNEKSLKQAKEELLNIVEMINREKANLSEIQKQLAPLKELESRRKELSEKTDRDKKTEMGISGGWNLQLHIYRLIGPQGNTMSVDRQTQYTINLSQKESYITGELLGAVRRKDDPNFDKGLSCGQADIKGEIQNSGEIVLIFTYTGNCCPGSQEILRGRIDSDGNLAGDLKWARTGMCIGAWAKVVGTRR